MSELGEKDIPKRGTTLFLYVAVSIASLGGLIYGYDLAGIAGAILFIKKEFSLSPFSQELVLSSVLFGAMIGAALGGRLTDTLGRRKILIVCAVVSFIGVLGTVLAHSILLLIIARIVVGAAFGVLSFAVPLYISEISSPTNRGKLVSIFVFAILSGVLISYLVDYYFSAYSQWRLMFAVGLIPALLLFVGMFFLPESPRWLIKHGFDDKARDILVRIRGTTEVDKEIAGVKDTLKETKPDWHELIGPVIRPALVLGLGLAMIRQLTGLSLATFYAPTIFELAGFHSPSTAILETVGMGVVFVVMSIVAMNLMDRLGRRPTMLLGLAGMCLGLVVLGITFYLQKSGGGLLGYLSVASLIFFVAAWTLGPGTVVQLVISEIYPLSVRGIAMSVVTAVIWATYLIVTLTFLSLIEALGRPDTFWLYAVLCVVSFFYVYFYMPETKGLSLEEIEQHWHKSKSTDKN
ncbi:MAG: MFS transporter [Thermodesulfobacteriota bacterium]|nr:MAG: MFS transporter [Thermodesulfobacteriota bacterium]